MNKLLDLVESLPDVIVSIRAADLLAANEELIRRTRQELEQLITDANTETYPSAKKVAEMLDVDKSTLWRWAKVGNLVPINVGGKRRYRMSDVKRILGRGYHFARGRGSNSLGGFKTPPPKKSLLYTRAELPKSGTPITMLPNKSSLKY